MNEYKKAIIIGSDHAAYNMKELVKDYLSGKGIEVVDVGCADENSVDYPDIAARVAGSVSTGKHERGILLCGTGLGMSMAANRFTGVRAALCHDLFGSYMSRAHNDANILVLGGRVTGDVLATEVVRIWLETPFEGGRHALRIAKFDALEP